MCIRDRIISGEIDQAVSDAQKSAQDAAASAEAAEAVACLLYTSDAADELDGVDLGGRRIIKKKFFQAEDGILDVAPSRGLGDVYKRQGIWWR